MEFGRIPWGSERATNRTSAKSTRIADESCGHGRRRRSRTSPHPLRLEDVGPADRAEPSPLSIGRWLVTFKLCRSRSAIQIPVLQFGGRNALVCNRDASRVPRSLTGSKKPHGYQELVGRFDLAQRRFTLRPTGAGAWARSALYIAPARHAGQAMKLVYSSRKTRIS